MKKVRYLFTALLMMAVLGGCGSDGTEESSEDNSSVESVQDTLAESTGEPVYGGSVVVGVQQDIDSLDPHKAVAAGTSEILYNIFEGLVKVDVNGDVAYALAEDYSVSEDGLVYTFTLRDGVRFHNGNAVTAEDVKYSLDRASGLLDGTALVSSLSGLASVDIVDEKTVQVTVGEANTELIYSFAAAIIPAGSGEEAASDPIGTGPFCFVSYSPQEGVVLKKNADYWQEGLPLLDEVTFKIVTSADTALLELEGGSIDIYPYLTDSQATELADSFQILSGASVNVQALYLNNADPLLSDVRVRQAICYALDKDLVNDFTSGGRASLIGTMMLPTLQTYYEDLNDVYGNTANIEKAKELLTEAGYPDGIDLEITVPSNYAFHVETAEVVAEQLSAAGIRATINPVEWDTWLSEVYNGRNYQSTICAVAGNATPGYLMMRFQADSKKNFINFASEEYDAAYLAAASALDVQEKAANYKTCEEILANEAASAFLQVPPILVAVNEKLAGYQFYPVYVQDMSTVYWVN